MKNGFKILILFALGGCVNINGIRNPTTPHEIAKNMYSVSLAIRSSEEARADLFLFCEQKQQIYKEIKVSDNDITFYCIDTTLSSDHKNSASSGPEK